MCSQLLHAERGRRSRLPRGAVPVVPEGSPVALLIWMAKSVQVPAGSWLGTPGMHAGLHGPGGRVSHRWGRPRARAVPLLARRAADQCCGWWRLGSGRRGLT